MAPFEPGRSGSVYGMGTRDEERLDEIVALRRPVLDRAAV
jgi:hypothetical protein